MKKYLFVTFFLILINNFAQNRIEYFPDTLALSPFSANLLEPKMGFLFDIGKNELRLDVGNSLDIFHKEISSTAMLSAGVDFFTYSFLQRRNDFKFPVVAIDYLFGINSVYIVKQNNYRYGIRARLSHISAHFVDGHYNIIEHEWRDSLEPFVYSKEFFEFTPFYAENNFRIYATLTLIYHIKPADLGKDAYQIGGEYFIPKIFAEKIGLFVSSDLKITHLDDYNISYNSQLGLKFGEFDSRGTSVYLQFYSGKNIHGELFNKNENKTSIGINFDL